MKTITINDVQYSIPETWFDIKYDKFCRLKSIESRSSEYSHVDYNIAIINAITEIPKEELINLKEKDITPILNEINNIKLEDISSTIAKAFYHSGQVWVMDILTNKYIYAFFVDTEQNIENPWDNADIIASYMYRPAKQKLRLIDKLRLKLGQKIDHNNYTPIEYSYSDCIKNKDMFRNNIPMPYVSSAVFFCSLIKQNNDKFIKTCSKK